ncbi:MAG: hypothetical protein ACI8TP_002612 [Acidimicrobiales bacterium]|jgi:hypothetical protein
MREHQDRHQPIDARATQADSAVPPPPDEMSKMTAVVGRTLVPEHVQMRGRLLKAVAAFGLFVLVIVVISIASDVGFATIAPVVIPAMFVLVPLLAIFLPLWIGSRRYQ